MTVVTVGQAPDEALLSWFVGLADEQAFTELVRRHGPMVWATCRQLLGETPEVDDRLLWTTQTNNTGEFRP
jgi:hypothetical protein